jgi:hypothetical protein
MCGFRRPVARRTSRLGRGICCDVDPDEVSAAEPDDDEGIEQVETDSWNNEQVHGGNVRRVVTQEGPPSLAGRPPPFDHVLGDARLRDFKPERNRTARSFRQLRRFHHVINSDKVFGTHKQTIHLSKKSIARYREEPDHCKGSTMAMKPRPWTATEIYRLKGLAKKKLEVTKIARSLKRTTAATVLKARSLGILLDASR